MLLLVWKASDILWVCALWHMYRHVGCTLPHGLHAVCGTLCALADPDVKHLQAQLDLLLGCSVPHYGPGLRPGSLSLDWVKLGCPIQCLW
jgi:hypothetical protein